MTSARWNAEIEKMKQAFPGFEPFQNRDRVGFAGKLRGPSGSIFTIRIEAARSGYPAQMPSIYISPRAGKNYSGGALCVQRRWRPDRDTFGQQVLYAASYIRIYG